VGLVAAALFAAPAPLAGQDPLRSIIVAEASAPRYLPVRIHDRPAPAGSLVTWPDSLVRRPTYWKEGAAIGGAAVGVAGFALSYVICRDVSDTGGCVGSSAGIGGLMTFCGAVIGALIGGGIEKKAREGG
jgi:hypothetical protein